jgi:hypothetical protein
MSMIETLRQQQTRRVNVEQAVDVINNPRLSFQEKLIQVQALEDLSTGFELTMFDEIYSSLHNMAQTKDEIKLVSGN